MITLFENFCPDQPVQDQLVIDHTIEEYLGTYDRKMVVLENNWTNSYFNDSPGQSAKPFLQNIGQLIGEQVEVEHFTIHSKENLTYFLKNPGVLFNSPKSWGVSVWYFGIHGISKGLQLPPDLVSKSEIIEMCSEFRDFPNILYFSSCSLFKDDAFGYELLEASGSRGILGYKENVPFSIGTIIDLLFLSSFYLYNTGDPFKNLEGLYSGVIDTIPLAKELGFSLYI
jgi:hypothetical protein